MANEKTFNGVEWINIEEEAARAEQYANKTFNGVEWVDKEPAEKKEDAETGTKKKK